MSRKVASSRRAARLRLALLFTAFALVTVHAVDLWQRAGAPTGASTGPAAWTGVRPALAAPPDGKQLYMTRCMSCHQTNGQGIAGVFPPLDGSEWVTGDKGVLARIILGGMTDEVKVKGQTFSGAMPPWGTFLKDDEVAAIMTYVRSAWTNMADAATAAEVARVRAATAARKKPWTAAELQDKANQGIPQ